MTTETNMELKESYRDENSLELKLPSGSSPPFYAKQLSLWKKKMDIEFDYVQLSGGPASGQSPEFLVPAI